MDHELFLQQPSISDTSSIPKHLQISEDLILKFTDSYEIGQTLPSEAELCAVYNVSRSTIRQALNNLQSEGYIQRTRGKGSVLLRKQARCFIDIKLSRYMENGLATSDVKKVGIKIYPLPKPNAHAARMLKIDLEEPQVYVERIFMKEGLVVGLNQAWFPQALVQNLCEKGLLDGSITQSLGQYCGIKITRAENFIDAISLSAQIAKLLDFPYDSPAVRINTLHYAEEREKPVEYASTIWLGNRTYLRFDLHTPE